MSFCDIGRLVHIFADVYVRGITTTMVASNNQQGFIKHSLGLEHFQELTDREDVCLDRSNIAFSTEWNDFTGVRQVAFHRKWAVCAFQVIILEHRLVIADSNSPCSLPHKDVRLELIVGGHGLLQRRWHEIHGQA